MGLKIISHKMTSSPPKPSSATTTGVGDCKRNARSSSLTRGTPLGRSSVASAIAR